MNERRHAETATLIAVLRSRDSAHERIADHGSGLGPPPGRVQLTATVTTLAVALGAVTIAALAFGSVNVPWRDVWLVLGHRLAGEWLVTPTWSATTDTIVADVRLPRVLLAAIVGATLAVVGMVIQAVLRNPLAGPGVLGVSSGAATGAVIVLRFGAVAGMFTLNIAAFLGALLTLLAVFWVARAGGSMTTTRLVLSGMAISAVLSAVTSLLVLTSPDPELAGRVLFWTLGGFGASQWNLLIVPAVALSAGLAVLLLQARNLNLLLAGEESATTLGLDVQRFRQLMFVLAALLIGVSVAVSGVIGFVGLVLPHVVRLLVGSDHRRGLPVAALLGAVFMIGTDLVARTVLSPEELPVGIITALVGGPFFLWLLRRNSKREEAAWR